MASVLNNTVGKQFLFADHAIDFGAAPATANNSLIIGTPTDVQIDMTGLVDTNARASAKFDFGIDRPPLFRLDACIEMDVAAVDGKSFDFYLAESPSLVPAAGNPAALTGVDESVVAITRGQIAQMKYIGTMLCTSTVINISTNIGNVRPTLRYGMVVIVNHAGSNMQNTSMANSHITLTPVDYSDV